MLNRNKKEVMNNLNVEIENYKGVLNQIINESENLHNLRMILKDQLEETNMVIRKIDKQSEVEDYDVKEIELILDQYDEFLSAVKEKIDSETKNLAGGVGLGIAAGAGIASFGPAAALALATTFGTASSGAAIAGLSGAAATNAALAWLGGGALVAGGTGMAGGSALLALAGPVGIAIGGASLLAAGLTKSKKDKQTIEDALTKTNEIIQSRRDLEEKTNNIKAIQSETKWVFDKLLISTEKVSLIVNEEGFDLNAMSEVYSFNYQLKKLFNLAKEASELLNKSLNSTESSEVKAP